MSAPLHLVPSGANSSSVTLSTTSHPVHAGAHDTLRHGFKSLAHDHAAASHHPLAARLEGWNDTRDALKLSLLRNTYGMGAPMRTMLERECVVKDGPFPNIHASHAGTHRGLAQMQLDVLNGDDETLEPVDFLPTEIVSDADFHKLMDGGGKSRS